MKKLTDEEFYTQFHPIQNHIDNNASFEGCMYETYSPEIDYVFELAKQENRVWTIIEGDGGEQIIDEETGETYDSGTMYLISGFHYINRMGFLITEEPYLEEIEVLLD